MMIRFGAKNKSVYGGAVSEAYDIHRLTESDLATVIGGAITINNTRKKETDVSNKQRCYVCNQFCEASRVTCPHCGCKLC